MVFVPELIQKKRDGISLTTEEIEYLVNGYVRGIIPDYQMAAFLMAVYFKGMSYEETTALTLSMARSGEVMDLSSIEGIKVDKHSSGGIADTTTLVLLPLVASAGVKVAKMAGRGLGYTGGTIDKLESIPGFKTQLTRDEFLKNVMTVGAAITAQSENLVPADKKLYALRDVTATVESIPLIASSIMSKKLAGGADKILLDVKFGKGAFMKTYEEALELAKTMVKIGHLAGKEVVAYVTDMDQPLGLAIGNALEVIEAAEVLKGNGHKDLRELCVRFGAEMMVLAGAEKDLIKAQHVLEENIDNGKALMKFKEIVKAQEGNPDVLDDYTKLLHSAFVHSLVVDEDCYIKDVDAFKLGVCAVRLGAGREKKEDKIDHSVGIVLGGKVGDKLNRGQAYATIYANSYEKLEYAIGMVKDSFQFSKLPVQKKKLIYARITMEDMEV